MQPFFVCDLKKAAMKKFKVTNCNELAAVLKKRHEKRATRTEQIRRNKNLSKDERQTELKMEVEKQGLEFRLNSEIVQSYINNTKRAFTLSKSVELIRREHLVNLHVGKYYRKLLDVAYAKLKADFHDEQEDWSDFWQEEKLSVEEEALKFFTKAKENDALTEIRKCNCGEPLFDADELEKITLEKKSQKN